MQAVIKMLIVVANLVKVLLKVVNQFIQKYIRNSDSYHSDEYYENNISQDLSAAMDTQNQINNDQWIQIADQASDVIPTAIDFSPIDTPGPVDCVSKDSKPHDYFLHLFGEEFLM